MSKGQKGIFVLSAGCNAAGKSTVINPKYIDGRIKHRIDPDRLLDIPIEDILSAKSLKLYLTNQTERFAVNCMQEWLASERMCFEGIATESNLVTSRDFKNFEKAKNLGIKTELYFVGLSQESAIQRESTRAHNGEQKKIDIKTIESRYNSGLANIQKHIDSGNIDKIMIYDNSRGKGEEYLLLHIENGKTVYLHPSPPAWFKEAQIKIPPMAQDKEVLQDSKKEALQSARKELKEDGFIVNPKPGTAYEGEIITKNEYYAVQKVSDMGILHELDKVPGLRDRDVGENLTIEYGGGDTAKIKENTISENENNIDIDEEFEI